MESITNQNITPAFYGMHHAQGLTHGNIQRGHMTQSLIKPVGRMFYLQRCGVALDAARAGVFSHPACHTAPARVFGSDTVLHVSGGWHDAGDYGRYVVPACKAVADLLLAFRAAPEAFGDDWDIHESGNGVADVLDEVRFAAIKGNASEIGFLAGKNAKARGVDAEDASLVTEAGLEGAAATARRLSSDTGAVVVISGAIDIVAHPGGAWAVRSGHPLMARITGSGCMSAAVMGCCLGVMPHEAPHACLCAVSAMGVAGEMAAEIMAGGGEMGVLDAGGPVGLGAALGPSSSGSPDRDVMGLPAPDDSDPLSVLPGQTAMADGADAVAGRDRISLGVADGGPGDAGRDHLGLVALPDRASVGVDGLVMVRGVAVSPDGRGLGWGRTDGHPVHVSAANRIDCGAGGGSG